MAVRNPLESIRGAIIAGVILTAVLYVIAARLLS
jgi:amino acid transporter